MRNQERGFALAAAMATALLCSIAAFAVIFMAMFNARQSTFYRDRAQSRYLAEAALVIAMQKLRNEATTPYPSDCTGGNVGTNRTANEFIDTNGDGTTALPDPQVAVTVTNCGAGRPHAITATVPY